MEKYDLLKTQLLYEGTASKDQFISPAQLADSICQLTHDSQYLDALNKQSLTKQEIRQSGFPLSTALIRREKIIAEGTRLVAIHALNDQIAFNIAGGTHHANRSQAQGFCLLNDQAIAANYLMAQDLAERILIIDLDVHQGNGTAEIFKEDKSVFTFSMHGNNNFPFRKASSNLDVGLADQTEDELYLKLLKVNLKLIERSFCFDYVFYQAGVDVLANDKLGRLSLSVAGCKMRDEMVLKFAQKHQTPICISMGGSYNIHMREIIEAHSNTFRLANKLYEFDYKTNRHQL
ncbi:UNVERIFIED_CONTAM: hypothetical protein GTU68_009509 [Idotea baltica]|nr:hypothetical protein [Idotea baltica]